MKGRKEKKTEDQSVRELVDDELDEVTGGVDYADILKYMQEDPEAERRFESDYQEFSLTKDQSVPAAGNDLQ